MNLEQLIPYLSRPVAALVLLLSACSNPQPPPRAIPAPIQSAAVTPAVDAVRTDSAKQREVSGRLESQVDALRKSSADLRQDFASATAEAARLKVQKAASEKELDALWLILNGTEARAKALFDEVEKAKAIADEQKAQRSVAEKRLDELAKAAIARDTETAELRTQRDHLADELEKAIQAHARMQTRLSAAEQKAAVGTYLKGCIWFIGVSLFLALLFYILTKLRIL